MELEAVVGGYDIVGITKTWLGDEDGDEYNIERYTLIRKHRSSRRGGGVAVCVLKKETLYLNVQEIPEFDQLMPREDFWIELIQE